MLVIVGMIIVFAMVFGGYILAGGKLAVIIKALPFEMMMIGGAGLGSFLISNKGVIVKQTAKDLKKVFGNGKYTSQDYKDLLCLLFAILKLVRTKGMIAIEQHIENPDQSSLFGQYPRVQKDHHATHFICDVLRMMTMNFEDPHQVESMMENQLEKHHHEAAAPAHAVQTVADALPALGIVAAVLGVIKTMASINEPVEVLGAMIGGALVGTFLGVFLAYGFFGPFASKLGQVYDSEHQFYVIIRDVLVTHLHGNAPQVSVEVGRGNIPAQYQPSFAEMENLLATVNVG